MSKDCLYHIFNNMLPTLEGKTVLDVGSRLGAVLYGVSNKIVIIYFFFFVHLIKIFSLHFSGIRLHGCAKNNWGRNERRIL